MPRVKPSNDPRTQSTRKELLAAFLQLARERRYENISISEIADISGVGRSTFYEHYSGKDALLLDALDPLLITLANTASGRAPKTTLLHYLHHIWEKRSLFRSLFNSPAHRKIVADLIEKTVDRIQRENALDQSIHLFAIASANAQFALLRAWVTGEVSTTAEFLARQMLSFGSLAPARLEQRARQDPEAR